MCFGLEMKAYTSNVVMYISCEVCLLNLELCGASKENPNLATRL
jgi:hypothetical protein